MRALEGVRDLRERRMLTQQELADRADVSLFTVQRIERGEGAVRPKTGRAIAAALGVGVEALLGKAQAPLPDFEDDRRPSFQSWISFINRLADRWEKEIEEREGEWRAAAPPIRKNVKRVPNLQWANEIRATAGDVMATTVEELEMALGVATTSETFDLFAAADRLQRVIGQTDTWYSPSDTAKVIDFGKHFEHFERMQRKIDARAS